MAPLVFVCPLTLVGGLYADLHGGNPIADGFQMMHATLNNQGEVSHQITLTFNFETPLVPAGRIMVEVSGGRFTSGAEADHEVVLAFLATLRTQYQLFSTDFNLAVITEKRALFNSMRDTLTSFCNRYGELQKCLTDTRSGMVELSCQVSVWVGMRHASVSEKERDAVCALYASLKIQCDALGDNVRHIYLLSEMLNHRGRVPQGLNQLDATLPAHMGTSWERSYYLLRTIYDEAIKKFPGEFDVIKLHECEDGQLRATVDLSSEPFHFEGSPATNLAAAKAKLVYVVLKYVNEKLGHHIYDLHYEVRHYVDNYIDLFDRRTAGIFRCAQKLKELICSNQDGFAEISTETSGRLSANPCTNVILHRIQACRVNLAAIKVRFNEVYDQLVNSRVDRAHLEANLDA